MHTQLALFFAVMLFFYLAYSIHAAEFHDAFLGQGALEGAKAGDLESEASTTQASLRRALSKR